MFSASEDLAFLMNVILDILLHNGKRLLCEMCPIYVCVSFQSIYLDPAFIIFVSWVWIPRGVPRREQKGPTKLAHSLAHLASSPAGCTQAVETKALNTHPMGALH